jgi:hypothetical protein
LVKAYHSGRLDTKATYRLGKNLAARVINEERNWYLEISCDGDPYRLDKLRAMALDLQLNRLLAMMAP